MRIVLLLVGLFFSIFTNAAPPALTIECPLKMPVNYKPVKSISNFQFRDFDTNTIEFQSLALFDGDPKKKIQLKPDNGDAPQPHVWTLKIPEPENKGNNWEKPQTDEHAILPWVVCYYGSKSNQWFVRKLAKTPENCTEKAAKENSKVFNTIVCK